MKPSYPFLALTFAALGYASMAGQSISAKAPEVNFGRDVKPILSQHCFKCHGPDASKAAAGLRLDSFEGATKRLDDGAAIVPKSPAHSLLLERVAQRNPALRMPPPNAGVTALTPEQIGILRAWIAQGARYERHWSFVPPIMPATPRVSNPNWCRNSIDRFVLAKLDAAGLKPEPEADKNTLALRAAQTLTGLPPTQAELDTFRRDSRPDAYDRYVDRLLATPEYGEQQARYWLDAVRYGDTHGLQLDNERSVFPYRDWVVQAFNDDLPFNKFAEWQLAGDLLPKPTNEQLVATGYVRMNLTSNEGGAIEEEFLARNTFDRVDTTGTVFLGLTVGCARCHDHKFDPIRQRDYYGLYAFFDSTQDAPLDGNIALPPPFVSAPSKDMRALLASLSGKTAKLLASVSPQSAIAWFDSHHRQLPSTRDWQITPVYSSPDFDAAFATPEPGEPGQPDANWKPIKFEIGRDHASLVGKDNSAIYVKGTVTVAKDTAMTLGVSSDDAVRVWLNGKLIHSHKVSRGVNEGIDKVKAEFHAGDNVLIAKLINGAGPDGLNIRLGSDLDQRIDDVSAAYRKAPESPSAQEALRAAFLDAGPDSPTATAYRNLQKQKSDLEATIPKTLIAQEMPMPRPTFILKRGLYDQKGEAVERHIPSALGALPAGAPHNRLGFAQWLISPTNPLVSRVFVNRVWQQNFGTGIVKTSEDFGSQGEWPLNQPLLDSLAVSFVKNGWSVKKLNRMIVTSAAFRQSSRITPQKLAKDPENRLISRGPRFRLDAEVIRDKALEAGGLLLTDLGGRGFKPYQPDGLWEGASDPESGTHIYKQDHGSQIYRRSLYLFWKRTSPPPVMITFDAPSRDNCTVRRSSTNTPLQALTTLNETAFLEASRQMAERLLARKEGDEQRLRTAFDIALARPPQPREVRILLTALKRYRAQYTRDPKAALGLESVGETLNMVPGRGPEEAAWMIVCSTLMNTDEFLTLH
jgi:mono/diheme cytochrome c family protein